MFRLRYALAVMFVAVGFTPVAPVSPAQADSNPAVALCRYVLLPARPASNLGECVSYINTANNQADGEPAHECDFLAENDPDTFELLFTTRSQCIQAFGLRGKWK